MNATATRLLATVDGTKPLIEYDSRKANYNTSSKSIIYPVCKMRWENSFYRKPSKYLTLIDLLPLSEIIYNYTPNHYDDTSDVKKAVSRIYEGTNIGSILVEQIDPMSQFTRSMIVYFEDLKIRVLVIRGTIMTIRPSATSAESAFLTTGRDKRNISAIASSEGNLASGFYVPSMIFSWIRFLS